MRALLIVESCFGNTKTIAEAIAAGMEESGAQVQIARVDTAAQDVLATIDLLILGAPTHNRGLSTTATRRKAAAAGAVHSQTGMREWLDGVVLAAPDPMVAAFDTGSGRGRLSGSAATSIARLLARRGISCRTKAFVVGGVQGPLAPGEIEKAKDWGRTLIRD